MFQYTEKPGKTLYLLKAKSKPTPSERKRKKIELLGDFQKYVSQSKKKSDLQINQQPAGQPPSQPPAPGGILQFMAPAPSSSRDPNAKGAGNKDKDAKMNLK